MPNEMENNLEKPCGGPSNSHSGTELFVLPAHPHEDTRMLNDLNRKCRQLLLLFLPHRSTLLMTSFQF